MENEEAAAALADLENVRQARSARLRAPQWYWHAVGGALLAIESVVFTPLWIKITVTVIVAIGLGVTIGAYQQHAGFRPKRVDRAGVLLGLATVLSVAIIGAACWLIGYAHYWTWMAVVSGVLTYGAVFIIGQWVERRVTV